MDIDLDQTNLLKTHFFPKYILSSNNYVSLSWFLGCWFCSIGLVVNNYFSTTTPILETVRESTLCPSCCLFQGCVGLSRSFAYLINVRIMLLISRKFLLGLWLKLHWSMNKSFSVEVILLLRGHLTIYEHSFCFYNCGKYLGSETRDTANYLTMNNVPPLAIKHCLT